LEVVGSEGAVVALLDCVVVGVVSADVDCDDDCEVTASDVDEDVISDDDGNVVEEEGVDEDDVSEEEELLGCVELEVTSAGVVVVDFDVVAGSS
jgi:hypothetical protein